MDHKFDIVRIVYIQEDEDNYKLVRFNGMDQLREALKEHDVRIGKNVNIGREVLIANGVTIGDDTTIEAEATLENNVRIGKGCLVKRDAFIGKNSRLGDRVTLGEKTEIGRMAIIGDESAIGQECIIQDNVQVGWAAQIKSKVYIGNESKLGHHTVIGLETKLGRMVSTEPETVVDAHRTVHSFTSIAGNGNVMTPDEQLKNHYKPKELPLHIGGEKPQGQEQTPHITIGDIREPQKGRKFSGW